MNDLRTKAAVRCWNSDLQGEGSEEDFKYKIKLLIYHKIDDIDSELYEKRTSKSYALEFHVNENLFLVSLWKNC